MNKLIELLSINSQLLLTLLRLLVLLLIVLTHSLLDLLTFLVLDVILDVIGVRILESVSCVILHHLEELCKPILCIVHLITNVMFSQLLLQDLLDS